MQLCNLHENYSLFLKYFYLEWKFLNCNFQQWPLKAQGKKKMGVVNPELLCRAVQPHLAWLGNCRKDGGKNAVVKMPYRKHFS